MAVIDSARYTITYTPSKDRILPAPRVLHVRIKNASAVPLRAAYLHGPYALYVSAYPSSFDPNQKVEAPKRDGTPQFEPNLKAGGSWGALLTVPEHVRTSATDGDSAKGVTWIVEIASQIIFSASASVHFELLVGRDEGSLSLGLVGTVGTGRTAPGRIQDHQQSIGSRDGHHTAQRKGVFSKAIDLIVDDTASLWNKPHLPDRHEDGSAQGAQRDYTGARWDTSTRHNSDLARENGQRNPRKKQKHIHLVILTHGLHGNLGSDMLYMKESIDAGAAQARIDARRRRKTEREKRMLTEVFEASSRDHEPDSAATPGAGTREEMSGSEDDNEEKDAEEEEVVVRGFSGNEVRTEKGIKYLGKRLAKYVLSMTFPEQPFLPVKKSSSRSFSMTLTGSSSSLGKDDQSTLPVHAGSTVHREVNHPENLAYKITSISFIAHSLGGLIQTYAIAYIQKHSPHFFDEIKPINFVTMATPFLGLSNENPLYVKFALDFGLVGRTGQDLGLTWRAPNIARSGWEAVVGGIGSAASKAIPSEQDPNAKPLLRILPTGPAHQVLRRFRNRTVYSNVVNDGIVPLRTSCLLFLDWRGLDRVEKARRENGLVGTMVGWGWAEMTGANSSPINRKTLDGDADDETTSDEDSPNVHSKHFMGKGHGDTVPQPSTTATTDDNADSQLHEPAPISSDGTSSRKQIPKEPEDSPISADTTRSPSSGLSGFLNFFQPHRAKSLHRSSRSTKIYSRSQTIKVDGQGTVADDQTSSDTTSTQQESSSSIKRPMATRGDSAFDDANNVSAPPRTTFFESAGDVLNPPLPSEKFIIDPTSRPRTIFHDRVYHPEDIPPVPSRSRSIASKAGLTADEGDSIRPDTSSDHPLQGVDSSDNSSMKVEEKIARAYHRDLTWRKVLVRLEPDAHNNMVVRRMFANAYGWPVIKHLVDTHFSDTYVARTEDKDEPSDERAKKMNETVGESGEEVDHDRRKPHRTKSELQEVGDRVGELKGRKASEFSSKPRPYGDDSSWSDHYFEVTDDEDEPETAADRGRPGSPLRSLATNSSQAKGKGKSAGGEPEDDDPEGPDAPKGTSETVIDDFLTASPVAIRAPASILSKGSKPSDQAREADQRNLARSGSLTDVGLKKSPEDSLNQKPSVQSSPHAQDEGFVHHVARLRFEDPR